MAQPVFFTTIHRSAWAATGRRKRVTAVHSQTDILEYLW
jgi:hypothetical protein